VSHVAKSTPAFGPLRPAWPHRLLAAWCRRPNHPGKLRLLRWVKRLLGIRDLVVSLEPGVVVSLDWSDFVQREMLFHGAYEPGTLALFRRLLADAELFVDIGAHVGQYSLVAAAALAGRGRVCAFEPTPKTAARLLQNVRHSAATNLRVYTFGISDTAGLATMTEPEPHLPGAENSGGTRIAGEYTLASHTIATVPLATVAATEGWHRIDVAKIDVEGHEAHVLRSLFAAGVPRPRHLLIEFIPDSFAYDGRPEQIPELLRTHGYELRDIRGVPCVDTVPRNIPEGNLWATRCPRTAPPLQ
jgi:FkbM family methyltransferase